jgi:predicted transcriptional regulator
MSASTTMTIRLATDTKEKLEQIAADTRRSKSFLASEAVAAYVDRELQIIKGIKTGLDDAAVGRVMPHDEAVAEMRAVIAEAKQRKAERG